jgi:hypothetical protein
MKRKTKQLKVEDVTKELIRYEDFGCRNCLFQSCECVNQEKFAPALTHGGYPTCKTYVYYD